MKSYTCSKCARPPDCPQLKDDVWAKISSPDDILCLRHAEEALGREIDVFDLAQCPANTFALRQGLAIG